ncbi:MAG: DUF2334 domain-containing protein [Kofleriaceae bacterium]
MKPQLLISIHDVSPLTLSGCREAVAILTDAGVPESALTLLVIPFHREEVPLDQHEPTLRFVHEHERRGATLVAHGYTHQMHAAPRTPWRWLAARWFARGEGELAGCDTATTHARLDHADAIFVRAGLANRVRGFVPPAWMLSSGAATAIRARGYEFYETFAGIVIRERVLARRLIGWGSLTVVEASATASWARVQVRRRPCDTRLAVHPPDLARPTTRRSLLRTVRALLDQLRPVSYAAYVAENAQPAMPRAPLAVRDGLVRRL